MFTSLVVQMVTSLPAVQETQVWSLDREDPLEKEMATCSSILAWKILLLEGGAWQATFMGSQGSDMTEWLPSLRVHKIMGQNKFLLNSRNAKNSWIKLLTRWTWIWASSGNWWWTGKPGVLQSMGSHIVGHNWANELNRRGGKKKERERDYFLLFENSIDQFCICLFHHNMKSTSSVFT